MRFKWKVAFALLVGGLAPVALVLKIEIDRLNGFARQAATEAMQTQIDLKGQAVESYFGQVIELSQSLSSRPETAGALRAMGRTAGDIAEKQDFVVDEAALAARYDEQARLTAGVTPGQGATWLKGLDEAARRLQSAYIATNPQPLGDKDKTDNPKDGSAYSSLHRANHPTFRDFKERFGFYDLFLIEPEGGRVVYSVEKELDFGTSLVNGPYADTGFAKGCKR